MMLCSLIVLVWTGLCGFGPGAQDPQILPEAAPGSIIESWLDEADADDVFSPLPSSFAAKVLHEPSGMVCHFDIHRPGWMEVTRTGGPPHHAACYSEDGAEWLEVHAYPASQASVRRRLDAEADERMEQGYAVSHWRGGPAEGRAPFIGWRRDAVDGPHGATGVMSAVRRGDWIIVMRIGNQRDGPEDDRRVRDAAGAIWRVMMLDLAEHAPRR